MRRPITLRRTTVAVPLTALATVLTGCGGSDDLELGTSADISFYATGGSSAVGSGSVTVTDVREGSAGELEAAGFSLDDDEAASDVFYVDVTFDNEGDTPVIPRSPGGEDPDGNLISALTVIELGGAPFDECPGVPEEMPAGGSVDACAILLVPSGRELERISYFPGGSDDFLYWETGL